MKSRMVILLLILMSAVQMFAAGSQQKPAHVETTATADVHSSCPMTSESSEGACCEVAAACCDTSKDESKASCSKEQHAKAPAPAEENQVQPEKPGCC